MGIVGDGNGGVLVDPPACVPAQFGLLSVAEVEDRPDGHWMGGVEYELETCEGLFVLTPKCNQLVQDLDPKDASDGTVDPDNFGDPFTLVSGYECGAVGRPLSQSWELAESRLDRWEEWTVENVFWNGVDRKGNNIRTSLGGNDDIDDVTPLAGAVSLTEGIAALEAFAASRYPCQPVLHITRAMGVPLGAANVIKTDDGKTMHVTGTGSRVVVGGGYGADGPGGVAPDAGEGWMYVTGSLKVLRGPKFFTPDRGDDGAAVDRVVNNVTVFAERTYTILQDCIVGAVRVAL